MNESSSRKSSRRSAKSNSEEVPPSSKRDGWSKRKLTCNWNLTCKALFVGLMLMFIGGSMATIGYFVDHIYTPSDVVGNQTVTAREKSKLNINSISTYVGPMVMGVGGFIVVAACVMTFEQRDNAAKVLPNRLHLSSAHGHSINRHNKPSPGSRQPLREGSGRRHTPSSHQADPLEEFSRRDLTADFIQFSRNLQQVNIEKNLAQQVMSRCPSAPNLAGTPDLFPASRTSSPRHTKLSRNSLHPLIGQSFLSPHVLQRQALSVDNPEYYPQTISPPRSKRASRQGSSSTGKGSAESLEAELSKKSHSSQASMMLDLHMPNDCPVTMRIRDRNKRSDTARRHLLVRQAQIESEEDSIDKDSRCSSPQFNVKIPFREERFQSSSTPHSRRESFSPRIPSIDDACYQHRYRLNDIVLRGSSPSLQYKRGGYLRSNTICNEISSRRGSNTSEASYRKGSADYNYRGRRKSSNTSESSRYCSRTNVDDYRYRKDTRSPTSLRSFQELRYISQKLNEQEMKTERLMEANRKRKESKSGKSGSRKSAKAKSVVSCKNQSLSPDSVSVSSSTTEGHSRAEFTSIEIEPTEEDVTKKA